MVNRFINFRAYIKPLNKVYKVKNLFIENKGIEPVDENGSSVSVDGLTNQFYEEEYILMQSTGVIDKNGKEIFEGDIVKDIDEICTIEYINTKCGFSAVICKVQHKNGFHCLTKDITSNLEVIGNIYENINLIKE